MRHACRFYVTSFVIATLGTVNVLAYNEDSSFTVFYPSRDFKDLDEAATQARDSGFADYSDVVKRAAKKDVRGLNRLFDIDAHASWDAAGGEQQNSVMRQMLLIWGDYDFAHALARESRDVQKRVCSNFRMQPHDKSFSILFPHTARIIDRLWPKEEVNSR